MIMNAHFAGQNDTGCKHPNVHSATFYYFDKYEDKRHLFLPKAGDDDWCMVCGKYFAHKDHKHSEHKSA
jgi:hypothetical protein